MLGGIIVIGGMARHVDFRAGFTPATASASSGNTAASETADKLDQATRSGTDGIILPGLVVKKMKLATCLVSAPTHAIHLPGFQGVLALDNDCLSRVHTRFGGEIVGMGISTDGSDPAIRVGDYVQRGDLLAVVWSAELGQKKSELVDGLVKLRSEEQLRDRLKKLFEEGAGPGRNYRDAERDVQSRLVEIASLERTLRTWRVTERDLADVRSEADRLALADELSEATMSASEINDWAKVEVRAPISGVILEKNAVVGDIVGTETDLFKIGDLSQLVVWAHVYEEDLPLLESLPYPVPWTVALPSRPGVVFSGKLKKLGAVIEPTQHTALARGEVENPHNELKIGQFVTVTIELPAPHDQIALPAAAVVEDGRQSFVFVQPNPDEPQFVRRAVHVLRRFRDEIYVKSPEKELQLGDHVVTSGALMLQNALEQLPPPVLSNHRLSLNSDR